MILAATILVAIVAVLHLYFLVLEMFLWDKPTGLRAFGLTQEFATASKSLAANQGLYNGLLAAGLIWGLTQARGKAVDLFLTCVIVAGIYGATAAARSSSCRPSRRHRPRAHCFFGAGLFVSHFGDGGGDQAATAC